MIKRNKVRQKEPRDQSKREEKATGFTLYTPQINIFSMLWDTFPFPLAGVVACDTEPTHGFALA